MPKMGEAIQSVQFAFDCPIHGLQTQVLCFRAFDPELRHRWHKLFVSITEVPTEAGEIDKYVKDLEKG